MSNKSPQWRFRCPLCLRTLRSGQQLILFKTSETDVEAPVIETIDCRDDVSFMEDVKRFVRNRGDNIVGGVFVSHVNCTSKNPFVGPDGKNKLRAGESVEDGDGYIVEVSCEFTQKPMQVSVRHWIIGMLRKTSAYSESYASMWFPYLLLAATASTDELETERPCGNLIEIAGTRSVGKTVMTVQLMHEDLFSPDLKSFEYFFRNLPRNPTKKEHPFFEELITFFKWKELPSFRPPATSPTSGDLRAVFILRNPPPAGVRPSNNSQTRRFAALRWLGNLFNEGTTLASGTPENERSRTSTFDLRPSKTRLPVLFYDSAGESNEANARINERLRAHTNKLVICIDAEELIGKATPENERSKNDSIRHAQERLEVIEQNHRKINTCIAVTKSDLIEDDLSPSDRESLDASLSRGRKASQAARTLLLSLLKKNGTKVATSIGKDLKLVNEVFFVGTRNLPLMHGIRYSPISAFVPRQAQKGDTVTIKANTPYYKFKVNGEADPLMSDSAVLTPKVVSINRKPTERMEIRDSETIEVVVPEDSRGFIEIVSEWHPNPGLGLGSTEPKTDAANSDTLFNVLGDANIEEFKPQSFGLTRFLAWCADVDESEIVSDTLA